METNMANVLKVLGTERACNTTANTYGNNVLVRLTYPAATTASFLVTCKYANGTTKYTVSIGGGQELLLVKDYSDTLESADSGTAVKAVQVAYGN